MTDPVNPGDTTAPRPVLKLENLSISLPKGADRSLAVSGASLELHPGEILCLVGESGSGKSVLSAAVMGAVPRGLDVVAGHILLNGTDLTGLSEAQLRQMRGRDIAMIFQEPMSSLNPAMTVGEQIEEVFLLHSDFDAAERRKRARALVEAMHLPDPDRILASFPHCLSGGQCQRVVIAMALALNPSVLVADEPTTALDVTTQAQVLKLIRELRDVYNHGILFITHDFGVVADIADRIAVMKDGVIVELGPARDVLEAASHPYTRSLIAAIPGLAPRLRPAPERSQIALKAAGLCHSFGAMRALDEINLTLFRGSVLSVVGESGSGKSTLAKALIRLIEPKAGRVEVGGTDILALPPRDLAQCRRRIQMIFQDPFESLNPRRRVGDVIARAAILAGTPPSKARAVAEELLTLVGLQASAYARRPAAFSGGQRQRIGIARALAMRPDVLIADESLSALDVSVQAQVLELLRDLQARLDLAMLFITHDLRVAAQISDDIIVMQKGRIVEQGRASAILRDPQHPYTRELLAAAPGRTTLSTLSAAN
ncbi:ABC transporter ATP-binding protein [Rhodobacter sp. 24-YEA-8]|uniref:dipeptide ABC transporter ATP-binding protein n=1 Tax=Rhodobacter sp. 24-YEA-8 TaxID=1884310 RepID=UPI00089B5F99|nr:ABC transporter ATP-binding protein [Rhodobacter sp. 24-YEA-8]SEB84616.1 peptide/nickel transport system ATP-binding protein [Rhodobacter sp. 24-YEA-8]